jgi:hypothetical protein
MNSLMGERRAQPPDAPALLQWYPDWGMADSREDDPLV